MSKYYSYNRILYLIVLFTFLTSLMAYDLVSAQPTQALTEDWRNSDYGFTASMMDTDQNDNVYVLGDTAAGDYLVIKKFDSAGSLLWQTTYNPVERLRGIWTAVDSNGDVIMLAYMITGGNGDPAGWLTLKYDANGNLLWANSLPSPFGYAIRVEVDGSDNIYVAGRMWLTNPQGDTTHDSVLIKYAPDGTTLWTAVFDNNSAVDSPFSMVISPDSSRIGVAGSSGNLFMALMYDSDGNQLWTNTNSNIYAANDLAFGPGSISYFASGTYSPQDPNPYQMAIVKFTAAGDQSWIKSYNVGDRTFRVAVDADGNIVATGMDAVGYMDWMTIKTDAEGNLLWSQRYDGGKNNDETPNMLAVDASGAVYVTGKGGPNPSSGNISYVKGVVVKYNPDGTPKWAVWDDYANGKAFRFGAGNSLATLAWGYLVTTHYTQTGLADLPPDAPTNLSGFAAFTDSVNNVNLSFSDNANNEFWVEAERCAGAGCTDFVKVAQSLGENATGVTDTNPGSGTLTYRVRAVGFMGFSDYSNTIEITLPNSPPVAVADSYSTGEDTPLVVTAPGVLSNDSDPDLNPLSAILDSGVSHGVLVQNPDGSFVYTPTLNYNGPDSFTYHADDGMDTSNTVAVSLAVSAINDIPVAQDDTSNTLEDSPVSVNVVSNDSDADGDTLGINAVTQPAHGSAVIQGSTVLYTPVLNYHGSDSFTYTVSDAHGGTDSASVSITVTSVNDAPVANGDAIAILKDTQVMIPTLANDNDPDGDSLSVSAVDQPLHGVTIFSSQVVTYTPAANYTGVDTFTYTAFDGVLTDTAIVTINVKETNNTPLSFNDGYTTTQGSSLDINVPGVLDNDTDVDGDPLTAILVTGVLHGTLILNADGSFTYNPSEGFSGTDQFIYQASDGIASSNPATVTITVTAITPGYRVLLPLLRK
jgi:hypothetical protein